MDLHSLYGFPTPEQERASRRSDRRIVVSLSLFTAILLAVAVVAVYIVIDRELSARAKFMRQCMEDHKEYECTALWRAGSRSGPDLLVLPIPLPR